ncbi:MAG: hypothetical protein KAU17_08325 [Spirochaetales bacterium]|nr:hypothetical protein [Spirochaetales bacterium]
MATWITHLRVAEAFKNKFKEKEYESFLIGNIAPDSGMLNDDRITYTPPSEISHYSNLKNKKWGNNNLNFYFNYIVPHNKNESINEEHAFKLGYFHHLFLDNLWNFYIYHPCKIKHQTKFNKNPLFIWEVKKDWYGIDKEYLENNSEWKTWSIFDKSKYKNDFLDFYPQVAISEKLKTIKSFYNSKERIDRPNKYLKIEEIENFVKISIKWISIGLKLIDENKNIENKSIMNLLEEKYLTFQNETGNLENDCEILEKNIEDMVI